MRQVTASDFYIFYTSIVSFVYLFVCLYFLQPQIHIFADDLDTDISLKYKMEL